MILSRACLVSAPAATQALQHFSRAFLGTAAAGQRRDTPRGACFLSSTAGTAGAGSLYMTGFSNVGALGLGPDSKRVNKPTLVETSEKVKDVACGRKFTLFATQSGKVYSMGTNEHGELGAPSAGKSAFSPVLVEGLDGVNIVQVAAGFQFALALSDDGRVFSWGFGGSTVGGVGALGHGSKETVHAPKQIVALDGAGIKQVVCGGSHAAALGGDGTVYTWGLGEQGRLGHGDNTDLLEPKAVAEMPPASFISCGDHFSTAIARDGTLLVWGKNKVGELGLEGMSVFAQESVPTALDSAECFGGAAVVHLACGFQHCVALTAEARVFIWGAAGFSHHTPVALNPASPPALPAERAVRAVAAGTNYSAAVLADGSALTWGQNRHWALDGLQVVGRTGKLGHSGCKGWGEVSPRVVEGLQGVCAISCGNYHTAFIAQ